MIQKQVKYYNGMFNHTLKLMKLQITMIFVMIEASIDKGDCDRKMVQSLDQIPYGDMRKWGKTARFLIDKEQTWYRGIKN